MKKHAFALVLLLAGCSTSKVVLDEPEFFSHPSIDFENVRFRRPSTPIYDGETVGKPVAKDAAGNHLNEAPKALGSLDCEKSEDFFAKVNLSAIRACLSSLSSPPSGGTAKVFTLDWGLKKSDQPVLELRNPEDAPECMRTALAEIPFPRELVYVVPSDNPTRGECYTSRLVLEGGDLLGWELPRARIRLRATFPLREKLKTDRDVERLLRAWTLSIYRGGARENEAFHGRFLPIRYCLRCLGIPETGERGAAKVPYPRSIWPSRGTPESVGWDSSVNF